MIKTKYVVGDVVVVDGKQEVVVAVDAYMWDLYKPASISYQLSNHSWYEEDDI